MLGSYSTSANTALLEAKLKQPESEHLRMKTLGNTRAVTVLLLYCCCIMQALSAVVFARLFSYV